MPDDNVNKASLVRDRLKAEIVRGQLLPGMKLNISELCLRLDVTLPAVREALSALEGEGLVNLRAKKGFEVAQISPSEFAELTEARIEVESSCLRLAIASGDEAWETKVRTALESLLSVPRYVDGDPPSMSEEWSQLHADFHEALASGAGNQWLFDIRRNLFMQSERYRRLSIPLERSSRDVNAEHMAIAAAAIARDSDEATRLMRIHLRATHSIITT